MSADADLLGRTRPPALFGPGGRPSRPADPRDEGDEAACPAFGFLRGLRDRALAVEFRLATGNTVTFPYSWLGPVRHDPSAGLLLKFVGDVVTLVLVRGSNLVAPVASGAVNLTDRGLYRHRVTWVREMTADECRAAGRDEPTIDAIHIAEFESSPDAKVWLATAAPAFAR